MDEVERKIIRSLNQNARKSFREVAKEVGVSVTSVINRVKKFEKSGIIKGYIPVVDPQIIGLKLTAIIALRISKGNLLETQRRIAEDSRIVSVYDITGEWDSMVLGYFRDRDDLNEFIKNLLSKENIDRSVTHVVLNVVKEEKGIQI
ncbi:Lrp/AsnC family transcriptional regulator [bacterium]|nr:Lrp/AsnC family transcriptional regulator [bacterium]